MWKRPSSFYLYVWMKDSLELNIYTTAKMFKHVFIYHIARLFYFGKRIIQNFHRSLKSVSFYMPLFVFPFFLSTDIDISTKIVSFMTESDIDLQCYIMNWPTQSLNFVIWRTLQQFHSQSRGALVFHIWYPEIPWSTKKICTHETRI